MKKIFIILSMIITPFISNGQGCNFIYLDYVYPSTIAVFSWNYYSCCSSGVENMLIDWGDGTTGGPTSWWQHYYSIPGTYYVTGSFYCTLDSTSYYIDSIEVIIECPEESQWDWENEYYTDSIVGLLQWLNYPDPLDVVVDSIDWGDGTSTNFEDTITGYSNYNYLDYYYYHNYGTSLDTTYTYNISWRYLYDSSCTYNFSWHFSFPCEQVNLNPGVWTEWWDKYRARFNCNSPNYSKYHEWYITEYGDSIYGNGTHLVYFPDTGYVHYCKYRQSLIDSTCFSFVCDSVYINDTIWGCINPVSANYNPQANTDDGSCLIYGCTDPGAINYDPNATVNDSSCYNKVYNYFPTGWNLFSNPVHNWNNPAIAANISSYNQSCAFNLVIKDQLGNVFWPCNNVNQIGDLTPAAAYQAYIATGATIRFGGAFIEPETTAIPLNAGWGFLGYPRTSDAPIDSMLTDILPNVIIIKDDQGGVYWTQFGVNQIDSLRTFEGYQIKMSQSDTLFYPAN